MSITAQLGRKVGGLPTLAACLAPTLFLTLGSLVDPRWFWAALAWMVVLSPMIDTLLPEGPEEITGDGADAGMLVTTILSLAQFYMMFLALGTLPQMPFSGAWVAAMLAYGLIFGQVGMTAAHDMIHRRHRWAVWLGQAVFTLFSFGHHASAHKLIHHVHVATPRDPNTCPRGRTIYGFIPRAWFGSFRRAWYAEGRRRDGKPWPFAFYIGGALAMIALSYLWQGWWGLLIYLWLSFHTATQMLGADYVQHYGLWRERKADGKWQPVGPQHSWDTPGSLTAVMMFNAGRHADHHAHPYRPYPALRELPTAPMHPASVATMVIVACFPPLWRKIVHPRLDAVLNR